MPDLAELFLLQMPEIAPMILRQIPYTGEHIPAIGLGTWQSFDVNPDSNLGDLKKVLSTMKNVGGKVIDSSPMYGRSEKIIGVLTETEASQQFFYATKVWIQGREEGIRQMNSSFRKLRGPVIDLMQIHNLVDWKTHFQTLRKWKEEKRIRYIGITHYTDNMHDQLQKIIQSEEIDFVQFNYSVTDRHAEKKLLPAALDRGVACLINRPFGEGRLFSKVKGKYLPAWAQEYGIETWSQFFLKFILSHPAVTCVIPSTSSPIHASDNFKAGIDHPTDEAMRKRMLELVEKL
jgi:diketogulonate reductase-like aldo/keto reductase